MGGNLKKKSIFDQLFSRGDRRKQRLNFVSSAIVIILFLLFGSNIFDFTYPNSIVDNDEAEIILQEFNGQNYEILPKQKRIPVDFVQVNDGDTIRIEVNGFEIPVRYLIINSPEMNYDSNDPEPFAQEAKRANESLLTSAKQVYVELDVGPPTDNYGRLLAYVYSDDTMINEFLVEQGLATVRYVNPPNNSYEKLLREAENRAREESLNIWE